ncbi:MAG: helix-turn-helix transcriptional regulator [Acidobacteriaceae bacterium]
MKAERLLSALLLLQAEGRLSGRDLAERLEVSERTIHRDMEALSAAGIPISAIRGALGGWQLDKGWRTQVPGMDVAELSALLMAQPRALGDPRLAAAAERAFQKVMAALSGPMRARAEAIRERLYVDTTEWRPSNEDLSLLEKVQDAVSRDRRISFEYTKRDGESSRRTVDPLGLVAKGASWYLVAVTTDGFRTFRISRMKSLTVLAVACKRPASFNLAKFWKQSTAELERSRRSYEVILAMSVSAARRVREWWSADSVQDGAPVPEGWLKLWVKFDNEEQARFVALGLGPSAVVIAPEALKHSVRADALAVAHSVN